MTDYIITGKALERWDLPTIITSGEIVRCKDCRHFMPEGTHKFQNGGTNADSCFYIRGYLLQIAPDGFCAWGERRSE